MAMGDLMSRYVTRADHPNVWDDVWFDEDERPAAMEVICKDEEPVDTGLVDHFGRAIWRMPEERKIGFKTG